MTSPAAVARRIKEELDDNFVSSRPTRRVVLGARRKTLKEAEIKKRRGDLHLSYDSDGDVELVRSMAPRRPYQWRGRRVQRILRPGAVVSFTPGERSTTRVKRPYDVDIEEDVIDLGYGKRRRTVGEALVLDTSNSTPSLRPVTSQAVLPIAGVKRVGDFQPTVQVMVPLKRARDQSPPRSLEDVAVGADLPAGTMEVEDIKVRPLKQVTPEVGVQTVDVSVNVPAVSQEVQTEGMVIDAPPQYRFRRRRVTVPRGVRYHPSISLGPTVVRAHRRRRRTAGRTTRRRRWTVPTHTRRGDVLPRVSYHPSITV
nr:MAG: pV protein [unidentified adenovirus]